MKLYRIAFMAVGASALLALAGCETPESRIQAACLKNGVMGDGTAQAQTDAAETKRVCECFTRNLKQSLTPAELKIVADRMTSTKKDRKSVV